MFLPGVPGVPSGLLRSRPAACRVEACQAERNVSQPVKRATDPGGADGADVCVNHRGADVGVPEQFLDRADILAIFEEIARRSCVASCGNWRVCGSRRPDRCGDRFLHRVLVNVMSPPLRIRRGRKLVRVGGRVGSGPAERLERRLVRLAWTRLAAEVFRWKHVLPRQASSGLGVFFGQGVGGPNPASSLFQIRFVLLADLVELPPQPSSRRCSRGTQRSFSPLPSRTVIWRRSKSMSFTRRRQHSISRKPAPYINPPISRIGPIGNSSRTRGLPEGSARRANAAASGPVGHRP